MKTSDLKEINTKINLNGAKVTFELTGRQSGYLRAKSSLDFVIEF